MHHTQRGSPMHARCDMRGTCWQQPPLLTDGVCIAPLVPSQSWQMPIACVPALPACHGLRALLFASTVWVLQVASFGQAARRYWATQRSTIQRAPHPCHRTQCVALMRHHQPMLARNVDRHEAQFASSTVPPLSTVGPLGRGCATPCMVVYATPTWWLQQVGGIS
jgi:hypothetical protein